MAKIDAIDVPKLTWPEAAAPSTPASGKVVTYAKSDGLMYSKDDAGTETLMSGGSGSATVDTEDFLLANDVNIVNATTDYDGPSGSFAAGTWLIIAQWSVRVIVTTSQTYVWTAKVWDGSTVYGRGYAALRSAGNYNTWHVEGQTVPCIVTLGSPTTLKISVQSTRGSTASVIASNENTTSPTDDFATRLVGYRVS